MTSHIALENLLDYLGNRVSEKRTYYRVSSTRELVNRKAKENATTAVVYGGLKYDVDEYDLVAANSQFAESNIHRGVLSSDVMDSLSNQRAGVKYLPATKIEAELIDSEFRRKDMHNVLYEGVNGTEESFIALNQSGTNILHVATHGFYWTQTKMDSLLAKRVITTSQFGLNTMTNEDKALTRSGLFLSGANITLRGKELPNNMRDGILTAQEISKIDLKDLDLAVLSACETGLGDIKSGEGIMGLQRGFKKAGANSILMSLWKVDDNATQKLMVEFYKHFLDGESKIESLKKAQQYVKSQLGYEDPEYWAGFILLDALN